MTIPKGSDSGGGFGVYAVKVGEFPPFELSARSRSAAMYEAFMRYSEPWPCTFAEFLKMASVRTCAVPANDGYDYIRRAYEVPVSVGDRVSIKDEGPNWNGREGTVVYPGQSTAYVKVVMDGEQRISNFHPLSVTILPAPTPEVTG